MFRRFNGYHLVALYFARRRLCYSRRRSLLQLPSQNHLDVLQEEGYSLDLLARHQKVPIIINILILHMILALILGTHYNKYQACKR